MKLSFIIPFHTARFNNLLQTLRFLKQNHQNIVSESELITVCQDFVDFHNEYSKMIELTKIFQRYFSVNMEDSEMVLSKMVNKGVACCSCEKIVVLESDRILPNGYFDCIFEEIKPKISITCKNMKKLKSDVDDEKIKTGDFESHDEHRDENNQIGMRNMWSGNTAFWKQDFIEAEKMDEGYVGYGWADSDMTRKMEEIGVKSVFKSEIELHLWHPSATYGQTDQKALFIQNGIRYCRKWGLEYPDWFKEEISKHRKVMI